MAKKKAAKAAKKKAKAAPPAAGALFEDEGDDDNNDDGDWVLPGGKDKGDDRFAVLDSDDEDLAGGADGGDEPSEPESPGQEPADDDKGPEDPTIGISSVLARVASGQHADRATIKERISDDVLLLGNWRKAKELGDKRSRPEVFATLVGNVSTYYGYAEELAEYFLQMFAPEEAIKFFDANEQQRPLTIRTNTLKARRQSLMQALNNRKVNLDPIGAWTKVGLKVYDAAVPVGATPEYLGGHYMIQSASSFIPVMALAPQQDEVILDMAAAPGGKTTYIGQLMRNTGTLFANDLRKERCKSLTANVHRLGLTNVVVLNLDGRKMLGKMPKLDRVLLDAPCTGSGIIARDPAVKVKRGKKEFEEASHLQKELLLAAIDMVDASSKTGGYIVYSTCSVSVEENEAVVEHALNARSVEVVSFANAVNFGVEGLTKYRERRFHQSMSNCRRYYPHTHNMDGFFVAKLKKTSNTIPTRAKKDRSKGLEHIKVWGEEKWTPEVMEGVMDFSEPDANGKPKTWLTRQERKKQRRQEKLAARAGLANAKAMAKEKEPAAVATEPTGAAATEPAKTEPATPAEPEEEPKPKAKRKATKLQAKPAKKKRKVE